MFQNDIICPKPHSRPEVEFQLWLALHYGVTYWVHADVYVKKSPLRFLESQSQKIQSHFLGEWLLTIVTYQNYKEVPKNQVSFKTTNLTRNKALSAVFQELPGRFLSATMKAESYWFGK